MQNSNTKIVFNYPHATLSKSNLRAVIYHKRGKIGWAKFSRFSGVPQFFFREYKCLSLFILNNEYL